MIMSNMSMNNPHKLVLRFLMVHQPKKKKNTSQMPAPCCAPVLQRGSVVRNPAGPGWKDTQQVAHWGDVGLLGKSSSNPVVRKNRFMRKMYLNFIPTRLFEGFHVSFKGVTFF